MSYLLILQTRFSRVGLPNWSSTARKQVTPSMAETLQSEYPETQSIKRLGRHQRRFHSHSTSSHSFRSLHETATALKHFGPLRRARVLTLHVILPLAAQQNLAFDANECCPDMVHFWVALTVASRARAYRSLESGVTSAD
jgi:hypothetical protein